MDTLTKTSTFTNYSQCFDCGREWNTRNAASIAARHAKARGHRAQAHVTATTLYDGRSEELQEDEPHCSKCNGAHLSIDPCETHRVIKPEDWSELL